MSKIKEFLQLVKVELIICIAVPIMTAVTLSSNLFHYRSFLPMIMVALVCAFAYGIIKMALKLKKNSAALEETDFEKTTTAIKPKSIKYRVLIAIIAIFLPLAGLFLNNSFFGVFVGEVGNVGGMFGDFSSIWFYIIALANGLVMLVDIKDDRRSLVLYGLKIIGFTYISYFTAVFLPIMPLGLIGLVYYGLGALVFVPAAVFVFEIIQIIQDIKVLKTNFKTGLIIATIVGLITLPIALAVNFTIDKANFDNALTYLSADSQKQPAVNITRLESTLNHIGSVLDTSGQNRNFFNNGANIPIISRLYQMAAFGDKFISPDTNQRLSRIFFGKDDNQPININNGRNQNVNLLSVNTTSEFDETIGIYKTWVELEMKNDSGFFLAEYRTDFTLPDGCFVKNYYLDVGNERKQGILADKRAALITYNNIIRTPRDPGIIYYKSDGIIELRVYPFENNQIRKTGFLVWHSQNETLTIDGREIHLLADNSITEPIDMQGISFVPASAKENLTGRERVPRYYFVLDASEGSAYYEHSLKVRDFVSRHEIKNAEFYAASYRVYDTKRDIVKREGGFNLPLAIEMILMENENSESWFPVIIAVSDNINKAPDFQKSNLAKRFPESEFYYNLGYDLSLTPYAFSDGKSYISVNTPKISKTLDYKGFVVADNGKSETVITGDLGGYTANAYQNAFILHGKSTAYLNDEKTQIDLVRDSFRQKVLTKYTAFMVLETLEQETSLLNLQAKFLSNDGDGAPAVMMDEPALPLVVVLVFAFVLIGWKRRRLIWDLGFRG